MLLPVGPRVGEGFGGVSTQQPLAFAAAGELDTVIGLPDVDGRIALADQHRLESLEQVLREGRGTTARRSP